jgi:hypothetical protein
MTALRWQLCCTQRALADRHYSIPVNVGSQQRCMKAYIIMADAERLAHEEFSSMVCFAKLQ